MEIKRIIYISKHILEFSLGAIDNFCEDLRLNIRNNNPGLDLLEMASSFDSITYDLPSVLLVEEWKLC